MDARKVCFGACAAAALVALTLTSAPATAAADRPVFTTVKLAHSSGSSEPRVTVDPDDMHYVVTNGDEESEIGFGYETVFRSADGVNWKRTAGQPTDQDQPTTDVDIVAMPTGRILTSELDYAGINFRTQYSDDRGKTWNESAGNTLADTDRQWYAVGPDDPDTHKPRVYLLFHNLLSGLAQHNMWVATSTDGGESFGPPIPVSTPGQQDYADLQCADSGGPSNIFADQHTGRVYVVFGTRSSDSPLSGCTAQPTEINVVAANRVWVVSADPDETATLGAWTPHLAVDDTGPPAHITGMQLAPGAVDTSGNVYVAYPESINDYPDYNGAAIKVVHASRNDLDSWSKPTVVAPAGGAGNILPHIVAGSAGKIDVAWYHGEDVKGHKPDWFSYAAQSLDALSANPHWSTVRLSDVIAEHDQTASDLMGACMQGQQATLNGFACDRATDVNGIALDSCGRLVVTWPAQAGLKTDATYVSKQTRGPTVLPCRATNKPGTAGSAGNDNGAGRHVDAAGSRLPDTGSPLIIPLAGSLLLGAAVAMGWVRRLMLSRR